MYTHPPERVRFGAFELDLSTGELRSIEAPDPDHPDSNNKVLLREQVFQVLRMLVERDGKIVTREEIKSKLWGNDTVVDFDQAINTMIKALRRALGDSADNPRYIETLGRLGYRLMLTIEYPKSTTGTVLEEDREKSEQAAAEMSENAPRVERQIKPRWWKAGVMHGSAVILVGRRYISWRHFRAITRPKS
jgi:DNA-binding winged helix-turn-helix (wHTH) protein